MPCTATQRYKDAPVFHVRDVMLSEADGLQSQRDKLARVVLDGMNQFVGLLDPDGNVIEINRAALEAAGIRLDGIQGRPFWDVQWWGVSEDARTLLRDSVRRASDGELVRCDVEIHGEAQGEETIFIDFSLSPVRDDSGSVRFLLAEGRRIPGRKRTEASIPGRLSEREPAELATGGNLRHGQEREMPVVQLAALRDVTYLVTAMISRLEHGEEVDIRAVLRRSTAVRENANRFIDAIGLQLGRAMKSGAAEEAAGAEAIRGVKARCKAVGDRES